MTKHLLAVCFCLFGTTLASGQQVDDCVALGTTLREYSISNQSSDYLNTVFDKYCKQTGEKSSSGLNVGLDAIVEDLPVKFSLGTSNSSETLTNFCKQYASTATSSERHDTYESKIASKALDVVAECYSLKALNGTIITHEYLTRKI